MKWHVISLLCLIALPAFAAEDDVFSALSAKMRYLNERQSVISQNLANSDTPKYKARDLEPIDFNHASNANTKLEMVTTSPLHIGAPKTRPSFKTIREKDAYDTSPDGNNVDTEQQMVKMNENDLEYQKTIGMMRQMKGLMRTAIGGQ